MKNQIWIILILCTCAIRTGGQTRQTVPEVANNESSSSSNNEDDGSELLQDVSESSAPVSSYSSTTTTDSSIISSNSSSNSSSSNVEDDEKVDLSSILPQWNYTKDYADVGHVAENLLSQVLMKGRNNSITVNGTLIPNAVDSLSGRNRSTNEIKLLSRLLDFFERMQIALNPKDANASNSTTNSTTTASNLETDEILQIKNAISIFMQNIRRRLQNINGNSLIVPSSSNTWNDTFGRTVNFRTGLADIGDQITRTVQTIWSNMQMNLTNFSRLLVLKMQTFINGFLSLIHRQPIPTTAPTTTYY